LYADGNRMHRLATMFGRISPVGRSKRAMIDDSYSHWFDSK
jgi:hypothetical protein